MVVWRVWCEWDFEQESVLFATKELAQAWIDGKLKESGEDFEYYKKRGLVGIVAIKVVEENE